MTPTINVTAWLLLRQRKAQTSAQTVVAAASALVRFVSDKGSLRWVVVLNLDSPVRVMRQGVPGCVEVLDDLGPHVRVQIGRHWHGPVRARDDHDSVRNGVRHWGSSP